MLMISAIVVVYTLTDDQLTGGHLAIENAATPGDPSLAKTESASKPYGAIDQLTLLTADPKTDRPMGDSRPNRRADRPPSAMTQEPLASRAPSLPSAAPGGSSDGTDTPRAAESRLALSEEAGLQTRQEAATADPRALTNPSRDGLAQQQPSSRRARSLTRSLEHADRSGSDPLALATPPPQPSATPPKKAKQERSTGQEQSEDLGDESGLQDQTAPGSPPGSPPGLIPGLIPGSKGHAYKRDTLTAQLHDKIQRPASSQPPNADRGIEAKEYTRLDQNTLANAGTGMSDQRRDHPPIAGSVGGSALVGSRAGTAAGPPLVLTVTGDDPVRTRQRLSAWIALNAVAQPARPAREREDHQPDSRSADDSSSVDLSSDLDAPPVPAGRMVFFIKAGQIPQLLADLSAHEDQSAVWADVASSSVPWGRDTVTGLFPQDAARTNGSGSQFSNPATGFAAAPLAQTPLQRPLADDAQRWGLLSKRTQPTESIQAQAWKQRSLWPILSPEVLLEVTARVEPQNR